MVLIGQEVSTRQGTLALLGLGSVGRDMDRLDQYSDLDFFVIVEPGYKEQYVSDIGWLSAVQPVGFSFRNTIDGHKALFADGIFCEFAVFEPDELKVIPFEQGRVIWKREGFDAARLMPQQRARDFGDADEEFLLGELLTNLLVGLGRFARGEKLSGCFFVQHHAVVRLIALLETWDDAAQVTADSFSNERRFEQRFPQHAALIKSVTPGYEETPLAAQRILDYLSTRTEVNEQISREIRGLIAGLL